MAQNATGSSKCLTNMSRLECCRGSALCMCSHVLAASRVCVAWPERCCEEHCRKALPGPPAPDARWPSTCSNESEKRDSVRGRKSGKGYSASGEACRGGAASTAAAAQTGAPRLRCLHHNAERVEVCSSERCTLTRAGRVPCTPLLSSTCVERRARQVVTGARKRQHGTTNGPAQSKDVLLLVIVCGAYWGRTARVREPRALLRSSLSARRTRQSSWPRRTTATRFAGLAPSS